MLPFRRAHLRQAGQPMFIPLYDYNPLRHLTRPYVNYAIIALTVATFFMTGGFDQYAVENAAIGLGFIPSVVNDFEDLPGRSTGAGGRNLPHLRLPARQLAAPRRQHAVPGCSGQRRGRARHVRYVLFYLACARPDACTLLSTWLSDAADRRVGERFAVWSAPYLMPASRVKLWWLASAKIPLRSSAAFVLGAWVCSRSSTSSS
jgi:hypothetical protein